MNICRFENREGQIGIGLVESRSTVVDLSETGIDCLTRLLESQQPAADIKALLHPRLPRYALADLHLRAPVDQQEVWAAGVTYLRSKTARMEESDFSATAYNRVYVAERPELFFKSLPEKVAATGEPVGIRRDARWSVPEPELALVLSSRGKVVGYTIGNDMSSRDIEGENLLYLPQAKIYERSCALGPWITLEQSEEEARKWQIRLEIKRNGAAAFKGETSVTQIKRSFQDLADFLFRCQTFSQGAVLLTGTGIVPPDDFSLQKDDVVEIEISGIGVLRNHVVVV
jgi:2-dehydro-3-deoxy-D-arabinonate dehydratase